MPRCKGKGCNSKLSHSNKSGYCRKCWGKLVHTFKKTAKQPLELK